MPTRQYKHKRKTFTVKLSRAGARRVKGLSIVALVPSAKERRSNPNKKIRPGVYVPGKGVVKLHRFVMDAIPGQIVDHINGDENDCRERNLRFATRSQNAANSKKRSKTRSRYKGVSKTPAGTYRATITKDKKKVYLGCWPSAAAAAAVRNDAARSMFGNYAKLNQISKRATG